MIYFGDTDNDLACGLYSREVTGGTAARSESGAKKCCHEHKC